MKQFLLVCAQTTLFLLGSGVPLATGLYLTRPSEPVRAHETSPSTLIDFEIQESNQTQSAGTTKKTIQVQGEIASYIVGITAKNETTLAIKLTTNQIVILDNNPNTHKLQLKRLEAILAGFDFTTIEEPIVEIDVRYKLPVLRTTASF